MSVKFGDSAINADIDSTSVSAEFSAPSIAVKFNSPTLDAGTAPQRIVGQYYGGPYIVTPTVSMQTLQTNGMNMTDDVTVNPIMLQSKSASVTPSETAQSVSLTPSTGYDGLDEANVSVGAISSTYVGSAIDRRDSSDLTASGDTVSVPSGFYENAASKAVAGGTEGTPTATKGTVTNHSVSVTPSVTNTAGYITGSTKTGTPVTVSASELVSGTKNITDNGIIDVTEYAAVDVHVSGGTPILQTKTKSYTPTESQQTETVTYDVGYDGLEEVDVTVGAISSTYVGSGITRRDSTDLTKSGATINVPAGYYENNASKSVTTGTAGTPTASKGAVSNHSISVTPSVTNTSGYITGSTITGTAVTVSASELVSGTKSITANGTGIDVTAYAAVDVSVGLSNSDAILNVYVPTGSSVTATKGAITLTPTIWTKNSDNTFDCAVFVIESSLFDSNQWTITSTLSTKTTYDYIVINSNDYYSVDVVYEYVLMRNGVYVEDTMTKYHGNSTAVAGTGYYIYKITDNNFATWYTNNQIDVTRFNTMTVVLTGGKTRYWDRFGLNETKSSLTKQNANIFDIASVSTGANGTDTTITTTLTLSTDISAITGSYWFGFTLEGTSGWNDSNYGRGGFKATDIYFSV